MLTRRLSRQLVMVVMLLVASGCKREVAPSKNKAPNATPPSLTSASPRTTNVQMSSGIDAGDATPSPPPRYHTLPGCTPLDVVVQHPQCRSGVSAKDWLVAPESGSTCLGSQKALSVLVRVARKRSNFVLSIDNRHVDTLCEAGGIPASFKARLAPSGAGIAYECSLPIGTVQGYISVIAGGLHRWTWFLTGASLYLQGPIDYVPSQLKRLPRPTVKPKSYPMPCYTKVKYEARSAVLSIDD